MQPDKQNYYPDFTLATGRNDRHKIAIDLIRTTTIMLFCRLPGTGW